MKKKCFFLLLLTLLALAVPAAGAEEPVPVRAIVLFEDGANPEALADAIGQTEGAALLWRYTLFHGAAVEAEPRALEALAALPGVAGLEPVTTYQPLSTPGQGEGLPDVNPLWAEGCTGDGVVVAILDSGLRTSHEVFADESLTTAPALTAADVAAFRDKGGTAGRYVSRRIPFAYDYYDRDSDVSTASGHGTHVAALAAGYARNGDGSVRFRGAAPGAQILAMKIFPDGAAGNTDDAIILRALEDAWNLGAGVINLSVGTGAGFSRDGILDGVYSRSFEMLSRTGVVVCCAAGNDGVLSARHAWEPKLPAAGYTDYGTVCSPASYRGSVAVGAAAGTGEAAVMADYSSWGPASGLHLAPSLTAPGGPVSSASAGGDGLYREDTGTSMASGSAAGAFAAILQRLGERGITDKREAGPLAQALLESSARILTEDGVPVSPRRQGAGLLDLPAALSASLVVSQPLLALGEREDGHFTLSLTLRNLSARPRTVSLSTTVLTDAWEEREGRACSLLKPMDITGQVTVAGESRVTVPANGEKTVTLELTAGEALRRELAEAFPNGFYVEGFVTASGGGESAHAAFLGYCGDWEAAPVLEPLDFRDVQDVQLQLSQAGTAGLRRPAVYLAALGAEAGANLAYLTAGEGEADGGVLLGANPYAWGASDSLRFAMSSRDTNAGRTRGSLLRLELYTLRSAAGLVALVSDPETGEAYAAIDRTWLGKSTASGSRMLPAARFTWDGRDASGAFLPGGTQVRVDVYAWLDTQKDIQDAYQANVHWGSPGEYAWLLDPAYDAFRALAFPLTLDGHAPTVEAAPGEEAGTVALTVRDEQCAAWISLWDGDGRTLAQKAFFPREAGEAQTLAFRPEGAETVFIRVEDYAGNAAGYTLDTAALLSGAAAQPERCDFLLLADGEADAWYHEAVDYALTAGILAPDSQGNFRPNEAATRLELVSALYRASGSPVSQAYFDGVPFSDAQRDGEDYDALCWAYDQGIAAGHAGGTFGGGEPVSRQQLAVMLWRLARKQERDMPAGSLTAFPDRDAVAGWAKEAVAWAAGQGILTGDGGRLRPAGSVTRAEAAQMLHRFLEG